MSLARMMAVEEVCARQVHLLTCSDSAYLAATARDLGRWRGHAAGGAVREPSRL